MGKRIYGLLGRRLAHSYSVSIHRMMGNADYRLIPLEPEELPGFMGREDIGGLNVTIPYKLDVMRYCDRISPEAREIGAVNTVICRDGKLRGYNTDKYGFEWMVKRAGIGFSGKKVLILGSGGASRTALAAARSLGAAETVVVSRSGPENYGNIGRHADVEILINTTPAGMYPNNLDAPVSVADFPRCAGVLDVIYNPRRTALLMEAERLKIPCAGGLTMLVAQAKAAAELFFDRKIPDGNIPEITGKLRRETENIVLIGMPGSGKSEIGKVLSQMTGRPLSDTDDMVSMAVGESIPDIFASRGEAAFRALEREAVRTAAKESGRIVVTGGGVVLDSGNYPPLHQNARIYHILRATELLETAGRPLSGDAAALGAMSKKRMPLYARFRDAAIENDGAVSDAAREIWRDFCENTCD
ncbi:MAG TPA: shikimate kinase [Clostridiales bacterium]|nr:shikimate kinase [Clostridiales bacterium]